MLSSALLNIILRVNNNDKAWFIEYLKDLNIEIL
jgi:hypothetical protein